jgi:predicted nuclease with TOPRIM domain
MKTVKFVEHCLSGLKECKDKLMSDKKNKKRLFKSMSYREVQLANSKNRIELTKPDQKWLKTSGYRNTGWDNIIALYKKIEELSQEQDDVNDFSLGDLFLEADRLGDKYLNAEEVADNRQKLAQANTVINDQIDKSFPDTENEIIDFSKKLSRKVKK